MSGTSNPSTSIQSALVFDGQDDYLVIPNTDAINFDRDRNFCIELWLNVGTIAPASSTTFDVNIIEKWRGRAFPYAIRYSSTQGKIYGSRYDGKNPSASSNVTVNDRKFHHIAFVRQDSKLFLYVDGIEQATREDTTTKSTQNNSPLYVAAGTAISKGGGTRRFFAGQIADLRIWNVARTSEEIQQHMHSHLTGNEAGLAGYWPLDEGSGTTAHDKSKNGNHGTIEGATWQQAELQLQEAVSSTAEAGKTISVLGFDGVDDNLTLSKGFPTIDKSITIEFWAKGENSLAQTTTIFYTLNASGNRLVNTYLPWGGQIYWDAGDTNGSWDRINKAVRLEEYNVWTHWAFIKDGATNKMLIYRNGELWHQGAQKNKSLAEIQNFTIGSYINNSYYWKGSLTEFRIWDIARAPEEIQQHMNSRLAGNEPGLVGYYPLNGDANDKTSNANHGTINGATWQQAEISLPPTEPATTSTQKSALEFDGKTDYIEIPYNPSHNPERFTISGWAKITGGQGSWRSVITSRDEPPLKGYIIYAGQNNKWQAWVGSPSKGAWETVSGPDVVLNTWTHVAATYDGSQLKLYLDGKEAGSKAAAYTPNGQRPLRIGAGATERTPIYFYGSGYIAEVCVWEKALTQAEIQAYMNHSLTGKEEGLVAYFPLNEGTGNTVTDRTDAGSNGTIHGNAVWKEEDVPVQPAKPDESESKTADSSVLTFDGADDNLTLAKGFPTVDRSITIEFWAKGENSLAQTTTIFCTCNTSGNRLANAHLPWGGQIYWDAGDANGSYDRINKAVRLEEYNTWTHWALVKDGATDKMLIYRNGELWHQGEQKNKSLAEIQNFTIGSNPYNNYHWKGSLTEFRIWDIARTPEEIQQHMNSRLAGNETGLVGYYPLNGDANDKTSNANHGTINGATWQQEEVPVRPATPDESESAGHPSIKSPSVLTFDGQNDYISVPDSESLQISAYTVEAWIKPDGQPNEAWKGIVGKPGRNFNIWIHNAGFAHHRFHDASSTNAGAPNTPNGSLPWDRWSHVAITNDGKTAKTYINGNLEVQGDIQGALVVDKTNLQIGRNLDGGNGNYFKGQIADIRIWDRVRSPEEIQNAMERQLAGNETGLVAYWPLNEGEGNTITDRTANGNHGTIDGATWQQAEPPVRSAEPATTSTQKSALEFDGKTDYIEIPYNPSHNPERFTISGWAKITGGQGSWRSVITSRDEPPLKGYIIYAGQNNKWQAWVGSPSKGAWETVSGPDVVLNTWTHVAATYDGSQLKLYLNGKEAGSKTAAYTPNGQRPARIGAGATERTPIYFYGSGYIAEVCVWEKALTQAEIQAYMNHSLTGKEEGLVAYFPLNEGTGNTVTDRTDAGSNGTIHGNVAWKEEEVPVGPAIPDESKSKAEGEAEGTTEGGTEGTEDTEGETDGGAIAGDNTPTPQETAVLTFDGIDDHLILSKGFPTIDKAITVEFWAKGENDLAQQTTIFNTYNVAGTYLINAHLPWGGQIYWDAGDDNGSYDRINKAVRLEEYNLWTHWAFVKDVATGKMSIYRNGELWHQGEGKKKSLADIQKLHIGGDANHNNRYWKGSLAELRIWDTARTPEEIQKNMNSRLAGNEPDLVGYYPLNGDANDKTSNANHGTVDGASWRQAEVPIREATPDEEEKQLATAGLKLRTGFSFDEAILMATFSKQAYDIFQQDDGSADDVELKTAYKDLDRDRGWQLVHCIRNDDTNNRGLILKNVRSDVEHQYAVAFRGATSTDNGAIDLNGLLSNIDWKLVRYGALAVQQAKVTRGFHSAFESVADEIKFFFKTLRGELKPSDFRRLRRLPFLRRFACITAVADAGAIRLGEDFQKQAQELTRKIFVDGEVDDDEELAKVLAFLEEQILPNQTKLTEAIEVWSTGHGFGGSLCQLGALSLRRWFGPADDGGLQIKAYAIAACKIGNQDFVDFYNQQIGEELSYRIENALDPIPSIPLDPPFPISAIAPEGFQVGDFYLGGYANGGEAVSVMGLGGQPSSISLGGLGSIPLSVPSPHSTETYIQLLEEQKVFWSGFVSSFKDVLRPLFLNPPGEMSNFLPAQAISVLNGKVSDSVENSEQPQGS